MSASNRSLNSGILHPLLTLFSLSTPKNISEIMFKITSKTSGVGIWIIVMCASSLVRTAKIKISGRLARLDCVLVLWANLKSFGFCHAFSG
jgi:hypothetical protein